MNINATLLGQILVFIIFLWVTLKYIWPPLLKAMKEREKKIAEGLEAGERGRVRLETAKSKTAEMVRVAKQKAAKTLEQATAKANQMIEEAKEQGAQENQRIVAHAQIEIDQQIQRAKEALRLDLSALIIQGAEKILEKEVDKKSHEKLMDQLITELK